MDDGEGRGEERGEYNIHGHRITLTHSLTRTHARTRYSATAGDAEDTPLTDAESNTTDVHAFS